MQNFMRNARWWVLVFIIGGSGITTLSGCFFDDRDHHGDHHRADDYHDEDHGDRR